MPVLRPCSNALAAALGAGGQLWQADLFTIVTLSGLTFRWTSWDVTLVVGGFSFSPSSPWLSRGRWMVTNTMEVPTLEVVLLDNNTASFAGGSGPSLRTAIHNGLLDGASLLLQRVIMPTPGDTTTLGTIDMFSGDVGAVTLLGAKATLKVRGKNSRLNVDAPKNVYQPGCIHTFCDPGCTLNAASFTSTYSVAPGSTKSVINIVPLPCSLQLRGGTLTVTSGFAAGQIKSIIDFTFTTIGLFNFITSATLVCPLTVAPSTSDSVTVLAGCDKTLVTCDGTYSNKVNFRGFPYIPPPSTAAVGQ